ncbi:MAG: hypothetical protein LBQ35_01015 [Spirochaetaceae bacterium]|jgi:hypothetical protein|nr:hypothetical protein [Spirochaetaceae bacterium]
MTQFYFLSILLNALSGGLLLSSAPGGYETAPDSPLLPPFLAKETPQLVLGGLTVLCGIFKLLSVFPGDLPVLGDFFPSVAGLAAGFMLVFRFYRKRGTLEDEKTERFSALAEKNRKFIGIAALASSALHFLFPGVLFL